MGPHGLCVGATGSGSELLRTLVLALAATHSPEDLALVLVDYKGGATFAPFTELPHVAGAITELENQAGLVERVHSSCRRGQAPPAGTQGRWQHRRHRPLRRPACYRSPGPRAPAAPVRRHRRVRRTPHGQAGLHRPVPVHRPYRPFHRRPPVAVQPAHRRRQAQGLGHVSVVPPGPADLLLLTSRDPRWVHHGRLPPASAAGLRLSEGRHLHLRTLQGRVRLRRPPRARPARQAGRRTARLAVSDVQHARHTP